jgi:hypothetical protein
MSFPLIRRATTLFLQVATLAFLLGSFSFAYAVPLDTGPDTGGYSSGYSTATNCGPNTLCNPLGKTTSFCQLLKILLDGALVIGIPIAILFIIYAGFKFVMAQGNPSELAEARKNFVYTVIGIAIFVGASLIATVIINTVQALGVSGIASCF